MPILDLESTASVKELLQDCAGGTQDVDPSPYMARFALNTSLTLNYGFRIDGSVQSELLKEITYVEREISNFRSTSNNWQDYVPLLRVWSAQNTEAQEFRARRDKYLTDMLDDLKQRIADGTDKPCITGNILKDPEAKLNLGACLFSFFFSFFVLFFVAALTNFFSRNQIYLFNHGICRIGHRSWHTHHGLSLLVYPRRTSRSSQGIRRYSKGLS